MALFVGDIWHKHHSWYFKIVSNFTRLTAREITYNSFEISLLVLMPNITTNHAITCTKKELEYWESNATLHKPGFIWMIPYTQIVQRQIQVPVFKY